MIKYFIVYLQRYLFNHQIVIVWGDRIKDIVVGVFLALLAYLKPIEGELYSLLIVFTLNFIFGYLSGMIAKGENFELKESSCVYWSRYGLLCTLCGSICHRHIQGADGRLGSMRSFHILFGSVVLWMQYSQELETDFPKGTPPWYVVSFFITLCASSSLRDSIFVGLFKL